MGIELLQVWGMTETGPLACVSRPRRRHRGLDRDGLLDTRARTGTILPGLEARLASDDGAEVAWDDHQVGDLAAMAPDGVFRIVDRSKDLVKSGGEWISSVDLEGHLLAHPDVADAAVVAVRSRRWDERPVAVLAPEAGRQAPSLEEVRAFLADHVARWWLPDEVVVVGEIPKTSVGKHDTKILRAMLEHLELP